MVHFFRLGSFVLVLLMIVGALLRNPVVDFETAEALLENPSSHSLKSHVEYLVDTRPYRNSKNTESLDKIAIYIARQFKRNCHSTRMQNFQVGALTYTNVICFFKGQSKKRIVIGAHYDVAGQQDGADDNASGVAAIIELSRILKANGKSLHHDLEIVAYSLEEPPHFASKNMGSYIHAADLNRSNVDIQYMLSVEMIGYFSNNNWSQSYPLSLLYLYYPIRGNFIALIGGTKEYVPLRPIKKSLARAMETPVYSLNAPASVVGVDFSDHRNYWQFGYDGYMLTDTSFYRNQNYHQKTDTVDTLDFKKMADIVGGLHGMVTEKYQ